jgi:hypothetical protein
MTAAPDIDTTPARRSGATVLARTQFVLAAAYVAAIGIALGRAASFSGHLYLPHQGDGYTGEAELWPGALGLVWWALVLVIGVVPFLAAATALIGVIQLVIARKRAEPARSRALLLGTILAAAVVTFWLTPPAATILSWLLD